MQQVRNTRRGDGVLTTTRAPAPRAFSLIEVLVVLAVVSVLVSIVFSVGMTATNKARIRQTESSLHILDTAVVEWKLLADRSLTWWQTGDPQTQRESADIHADTQDVFVISEVLDVIRGPSEVSSMLVQIDDDRWYTYQPGRYADWIDTPAERQQQDQRFAGSTTILDSWGTPIYATHPGRLWRETDRQTWGLERDPDSTIRTYNEEKYGIAQGRAVVFVSAGPDRLFGLDEEFLNLVGSRREEAKRAARADNLVSRPFQTLTGQRVSAQK